MISDVVKLRVCCNGNYCGNKSDLMPNLTYNLIILTTFANEQSDS